MTSFATRSEFETKSHKPRSFSLSWIRSRFGGSRGARWFQLGCDRYDQGQHLKALASWKRAGARGHAEACYRIGLLYARGEGVLGSIPDAVPWYRLAAERGHLEAQRQLALIYLHGTGKSSGSAIPELWLQSSRRRNPLIAQKNQAAFFANGTSIAKDADEALRWAKLAARCRQAGSASAARGDVSPWAWLYAGLRRGSPMV